MGIMMFTLTFTLTCKIAVIKPATGLYVLIILMSFLCKDVVM